MAEKKRKTDAEKLKELQARIARKDEIAAAQKAINDSRAKLAKLRSKK